MPIRPENKDRYPPDWTQIRETLLARANDCCEWCGAPHDEYIYRVPGSGRWMRPITLVEADDETWDLFRTTSDHATRVILTIAHLEDPIENCRLDNLVALCQRCHLLYDRDRHATTRRANREQRQGQQRLPLEGETMAESEVPHEGVECFSRGAPGPDLPERVPRG